MSDLRSNTTNNLLKTLESKIQSSLTLSSLKYVDLNYGKNLSNSKLLPTKNALLTLADKSNPKKRRLDQTEANITLDAASTTKFPMPRKYDFGVNEEGRFNDLPTEVRDCSMGEKQVSSDIQSMGATVEESSYEINYKSLIRTEQDQPSGEILVNTDFPDSCIAEAETDEYKIQPWSRQQTKLQTSLDKREILFYKVKLVQLGNVSIIIDSRTLLRTTAKTSYFLAKHDPEFILKLALYLREDLYIRPGANALLACAAFFPECRCYLKRYFNSCVKTPADWIDVAVFYKAISGRNLCSALKNAMSNKFVEFDEYQLAKYTKKSRGKKKSKSDKHEIKDAVTSDDDLSGDDEHNDGSHPSQCNSSMAKDNKNRNGENTNHESDLGSNESGDHNHEGRESGFGDHVDTSNGMHVSREADEVPIIFQDGSVTDEHGIQCSNSENQENALPNLLEPDNLDDIHSTPSTKGNEMNDEENDGSDKSSKDGDSDGEKSSVRSKYVNVYMDADDLNSERSYHDAFQENDDIENRFLRYGVKVGKRPTLKKLVQLVHASQPAHLVMSLLGKKYPSSREKFNSSGLPGTFKPELSGTRMKLETPKTWEVLCAQHGNSAHVWKTLLDENKLPYLALVKNIRNIILSHSKMTYHQRAVNILTKKENITRNQIPVMTFYSVLTSVRGLGCIKKDGQANGVTYKKQFGSLSYYGAMRLNRKLAKAQFYRKIYDDYWQKVIDMYTDGLNKCIEVSACHNYQPMPGSTLLLVRNDKYPHQAACPELTKALIVASVVHFVGENVQFYFWHNDLFLELKIDRSLSFMDTVQSLCEVIEQFQNDPTESRFSHLVKEKYTDDILTNKIKFDRILLFHLNDYHALHDFVETYLKAIHPHGRVVEVEVLSKGRNHQESDVNQNYMCLRARDDAILKFLTAMTSMRGLTPIEAIDKRYNLPQYPISLKTKSKDLSKIMKSVIVPRWKEVRVFISSTFVDMHGERNILVRHVFPALKKQAESLNIRLVEIDFRWGITEEEAQTSGALEMCLKEIGKCDIFIGIVGNRYGWVPSEDIVLSISKKLDYPLRPGVSITEMEMEVAALKSPHIVRDQAFFFIREDVHGYVPTEEKASFVDTSPENLEKLCALKDRIRSSGLEVMDSYSCSYGGHLSGVPTMVNLQSFSDRVASNVWNALLKLRPLEEKDGSQMEEFHLQKMEELRTNFVGYEGDLEKISNIVKTRSKSLILIIGEEGAGKSALLARAHFLISTDVMTIVYVVNRDEAHFSTSSFINYVAIQLGSKAGVEIEDLATADPNILLEYLKDAVARTGKICLLLDGFDQDSTGCAWLTNLEIEGVHLILTSRKKSPLALLFSRVDDAVIITVEDLRLKERMLFVRKFFQIYAKSLDESSFNNQLRVLVHKKHAGKPYYLKTACEELRTFGVFEQLSDKISNLGPTIEALVQSIIQRLESEYNTELITQILTLIILAKEGISLTDIQMMLSYWSVTEDYVDFDAIVDTKRPKVLVPVSWISPILVSLTPLVSQVTDEKGNLYKIQNSVIRCVLVDLYCSESSTHMVQKAIVILSGYFYSNVMGTDKPIPHHLKSCIVSLYENNNAEKLTHLLSDLKFIIHVLTSGLVAFIMHYYKLDIVVYDTTKQILQLSTDLEEFYNFIARHSVALRSIREATEILQLALFESDKSVIYKQARELKGHYPKFNPVEWMSKDCSKLTPFMTISDETEIDRCAVSHCGRYVAVSGPCMYVDVYDTWTSSRLVRLHGHSNVVVWILFSPDTRLLTGCKDGILSLWDIEKGYRVASTNSHRYGVSGMTVSPDGKYFITVGWDANIMTWHSGHLGQLSSYPVSKRPLSCIAAHPSFAIVAIGCWDSTIRLWDLNNCLVTFTGEGHTGSVADVQFNSAGDRLISASPTDGVFLWSVTIDNLHYIGKLPNTEDSARISQFSNVIVTGDKEGFIKFWNNEIGHIVTRTSMDHQVTCVKCVNDIVWIGAKNGFVSKYEKACTPEEPYNFVTQRKTSSLDVVNLHTSNKTKFVIVNLGETFLVVNESVEVIWQPTTKQSVQDVVFITNNIIAACVFGNDVINLWDISDKLLHQELKGHKGIVSCLGTLDVLPLLLAAGQGKALHVWSIRSIRNYNPAAPNVLFYHDDWVNGMATYKGTVITSSINGYIGIWKHVGTTQFDKIRMFSTYHRGPVHGLQIMENYIISLLDDDQSGVMTVEGVPITKITHRSGSQIGVANGAPIPVLLVPGDDTLDTVDITKGGSLGFCHGHHSAVTDMGSDGKDTLITASTDCRVHLWKNLQGNLLADQFKSTLTPVLQLAVDKNFGVTVHDNNVMIAWSFKGHLFKELARVHLPSKPQKVEVYGRNILLLLTSHRFHHYSYRADQAPKPFRFEGEIASDVLTFALLRSKDEIMKITKYNKKNNNFALWKIKNNRETEHSLHLFNDKCIAFDFYEDKHLVYMVETGFCWLSYYEKEQRELKENDNHIKTEDGYWLDTRCYDDSFQGVENVAKTGCCIIKDFFLVASNRGYVSLQKFERDISRYGSMGGGSFECLGIAKLHSSKILVIKTIADGYFCTAGEDLLLKVWYLKEASISLVKSFQTPGIVTCIHPEVEGQYFYLHLAGKWGNLDCFRFIIQH